jgi:flagellin-like hook-associated protein FlgL
MPIVVNSNTSATVASFNLSRANDALRTSLARLSSGKRIVNPADDAGGLSVANKLASKLGRTEVVRQNIQNGLSYLQVQDGALSTIAKVVDRMAELRTMASDMTKNKGDIENYSKEFIELQKQLRQTYNEKFNGISLFSMSRSDRSINPPDLRPTLDKIDAQVDESGRSYQAFSRNIFTNADGVRENGNVSLNVVNLQYLTSLGSLDTTYITETAAAIIEAQKLNTEQSTNSDGNGVRSFINLSNINGTNADDWTDNSGTNAIIGTIPKNDTIRNTTAAFTAGPIAVGDAVMEGGVVQAAGTAINAWDATTAAAGYATNTMIFNEADGNYYTNTSGSNITSPADTWDAINYSGLTIIKEGDSWYSTAGHDATGLANFAADSANWTKLAGDPAQPGHADSDTNWTPTADNTFATINALAVGPGFSTANATFSSQAEVDDYMKNEIYTADSNLQSIMFVEMTAFTDIIERIADARAENGAEQNRLNMSMELLTQNQTNLEAAYGRIMDADMALESTRFARQNVLVQSSAAMVAQANQLTNIALTMLG